MKQPIPLLLITGFLGAGKTTFLNWLIHTHPELKVSLILNEFGDIKLETQFITENAGGQVAELANGCMCCVAKSDIPRVVNYILEHSPQTEYIVIEASGLSDPDPINEALQTPPLNQQIRLDTILCIVDALNFEATKNEHSIIMSQVGDADIVLISKVKEAGPETVDRIKRQLERIGLGTRVITWDQNLPPALFLDPDIAHRSAPLSSSAPVPTEHRHDHEQYQEFWYQQAESMDPAKFTEVMRHLPATVIRAKGYINVEGQKMMVQYVGSKLELIPGEWQGETPTTVLLFLGKDFDQAQLKAQLGECLA